MGAQFACGNHLEAVAELYCPQCDKHLCTQCSEHKWMAHGFVDQCRACGAMLQHVGAREVTAPGAKKGGNPDRALPGPQAFFDKLPAIVSYPFNASVMLTLAGLALLTTPLAWATQNNLGFFFHLIGLMIIVGLEVMIYFTMVTRTAHGDEDFEAPDFDNMFDDFMAPIGRYVVALSPIIAGMIIFGEAMFGDWLIGIVVLMIKPAMIFEHPVAAAVFCSGVLLLPLLTAIAALSNSAVAVLNPALWLESLKIMWATYPIAVVAYYVVLAFEFLWLREFLIVDLGPEVPIPLVGSWLMVVISYIPLALRARILGAMCQPYLGDFE